VLPSRSFIGLLCQGDHGLCKFHSKLWNHGPIFGGDVHLCIPNNFCK
jgi:hypothetical protein